MAYPIVVAADVDPTISRGAPGARTPGRRSWPIRCGARSRTVWAVR